MAEIYLIQSNGPSPQKRESRIPVPLPDGYLISMAFPRYERRAWGMRDHVFKSVNVLTRRQQVSKTQLAEDIGSIAIQGLENRKLRTIAKAVLRPAAKYLVERTAQNEIRGRHGTEAAHWFVFLSRMYNVYSEQADTRSWLTLPDQIRVARLLIEPGTYEFFLNQQSLGVFTVTAGEKKFFIKRTER